MDTEEARKKMLAEIVDTDKELIRIYKQAAKEMGKKAAKAEKGGLTREWQLGLKRSISKRMREIGKAVEGRVTSSSQKASELPVKSTTAWLNKALKLSGKAGSGVTIDAVFDRVSEEALEQVVSGRAYLDGKKLSDRIWTQVGRQEQGIQRLIEQAVAQKKSAGTLAKELEEYLDPTIKDTPDASWYAKRLARTSINHAYSLASREAAARNPFCTAMHWQLGPGHYQRQVLPHGMDICDDYAEHDEGLGVGNWPVKSTPLSHACCLCAIYPVVPQSLEECAKELGAWLSGEDNPKLDGAFGAWKADLTLKSLGIRATMKVDDDTADRRMRLLGRITNKPEVRRMSFNEQQAYFDELIDASEDKLRELAGVGLHSDLLHTKKSQFGDKVRRHAREWGLDPASKADRERLRSLIDEITDEHEEIRLVDFSGQEFLCHGYIKGMDVVLYKYDGEFITIMKGGANNLRVRRGERTDGWIW